MPQKTKWFRLAIVGNVCLWLLLVLVTPVAHGQAAAECAPDRPDSPTRPGVPARPGDWEKPVDDSSHPSAPANGNENGDENGGYIALHIKPYHQEYWSEVEWTDKAGVWHVVEGWRSQSRQGIVRWFVEPKDFGKGLFRFHIYERENGLSLGVSEPFHLPTQASQVEDIELQWLAPNSLADSPGLRQVTTIEH